jgi:hypothetical protein
MNSPATRSRVIGHGIFFLGVFIGFWTGGKGNYFCNEPGSPGPALQAFHLALLLTAWDVIAAMLAHAMARAVPGAPARRAIGLWVGTGIAALGWFKADFILFPANQVPIFGASLDCSCFFAEGYGMVFQILVAPLLTVATFLREWLTQRVSARHTERALES